MITAVRTSLIGPNMMRVEATSSLASTRFRWFVEGAFYQETTVAFIDLRVDRSLRVDVYDDDEPDAVPAVGVASALTIAWEHVPGFVAYRIEREVGGDWETVDEIVAGGVRTHRHILTGLADETVHVLRVVGIDAVGGESEVVRRAGLLVRVPDVPDQVFSVTGGTVTAGSA